MPNACPDRATSRRGRVKSDGEKLGSDTAKAAFAVELEWDESLATFHINKGIINIEYIASERGGKGIPGYFVRWHRMMEPGTGTLSAYLISTTTDSACPSGRRERDHVIYRFFPT